MNEEADPVVFIDTVPCRATQHSPNGRNVVSTQRNGLIRILSGDLRRELWTLDCFKNKSADIQSQQIIAACTASAHDAATGIFKNRQDLLSTIHSTAPGENEEPVLLLMLVRVLPQGNQKHSISLHVHSLPRFGKGTAMTGSGDQLYVGKLPNNHERWSYKPNAQVDINAATARIDISSEKGLLSYKVTGYSVETALEFLPETEIFSSLLRLSESEVLAASASAISLYDVKHYSSLGRLAMDQIVLTKKRKRATGQVMEEPVIFVSYFPRLGTALALRGNVLLSLDTNPDGTRVTRTRKHRQSLLIDSINKGLPIPRTKAMKTKEPGAGFKDAIVYDNPENYSTWSSRKQHLDTLINTGDYKKFEMDIAEDIFGIEETTLPLDEIYSRSAPQSAHPKVILYAILICFSPTPSLGPGEGKGDDDDVQVSLEMPHLLSWLLEYDLVNQFSLQSSFSLAGKDALASAGAISSALVKADPSLFWLEKHILHSSSLNTSEAAVVIRECIFGAFESGLGRSSGESSDVDATDLAMENEHEPTGQVLALPADVMEKKQRQAKVITSGLKQLSGKPRNDAVSSIRSHLQGEELFALIQFLRQQLYIAGYTTSFRAQPALSPPPTPLLKSSNTGSSTKQVLDLEDIINLLSYCIDALGPSAALSADDSVLQTLITDLRSEVSSALEGVEEATYLQGILREVWRYGASGNTSSIDQAQSSEPKVGDIVTLFSQTSEEQFDNATSAGLLPLSLKAGDTARGTKRSGRQKADAVSRAVGKYSLERLVL